LEGYRIEVLSRLPTLTRLDKKTVSSEELEEALRVKAEREKPKFDPAALVDGQPPASGDAPKPEETEAPPS
jgi:hypothetical protein